MWMPAKQTRRGGAAAQCRNLCTLLLRCLILMAQSSQVLDFRAGAAHAAGAPSPLLQCTTPSTTATQNDALIGCFSLLRILKARSSQVLDFGAGAAHAAGAPSPSPRRTAPRTATAQQQRLWCGREDSVDSPDDEMPPATGDTVNLGVIY